MPRRRVQILLVAALLGLLGIVLPAHARLHLPVHADEASHEHASAPHEACALCRLSAELTDTPPALAAIDHLAPAGSVLVIDGRRPAAAGHPAPFHGRAPPAC